MTAVNAGVSYDVPPSLEAGEPPEARGLTRDAVRMLVTRKGDGSLRNSDFRSLPSWLAAGDLLVVNTSATIPAAIDATAADGTRLVVHLSTELGHGRWTVELRRVAGRTTTRWSGPIPSPCLALEGGATLQLQEPYGGRLWIATFHLERPVLEWLTHHGRPIRYQYVQDQWPLEMYQNVYASEPGSAEMPSAGRPFTAELITHLVTAGIGIAPLVLHTGVASLEADELPYPEWVDVPRATAERVNAAHRYGHRVIAVGTTVVRALETSVGRDGCVDRFRGWTDLVVTPERGVKAVDGLLTGWHEPASSHLLMLEAIIGAELLRHSYEEGLAARYRWHEFGDVHLLVP